jgi:hypothetical protein
MSSVAGERLRLCQHLNVTQPLSTGTLYSHKGNREDKRYFRGLDEISTAERGAKA